eukprot:1182184-Prorocentrum_minimum.AAC.6
MARAHLAEWSLRMPAWSWRSKASASWRRQLASTRARSSSHARAACGAATAPVLTISRAQCWGALAQCWGALAQYWGALAQQWPPSSPVGLNTPTRHYPISPQPIDGTHSTPHPNTEPGHPNIAPGHPSTVPGHPNTEPGYPSTEPGPHPRTEPGYPSTEPGYPSTDPGYHMFQGTTHNPRAHNPLGLDTDTVELTVKTLSSHRITLERIQ